jgi:hypothetical protein
MDQNDNDLLDTTPSVQEQRPKPKRCGQEKEREERAVLMYCSRADKIVNK